MAAAAIQIPARGTATEAHIASSLHLVTVSSLGISGLECRLHGADSSGDLGSAFSVGHAGEAFSLLCSALPHLLFGIRLKMHLATTNIRITGSRATGTRDLRLSQMSPYDLFDSELSPKP